MDTWLFVVIGLVIALLLVVATLLLKGKGAFLIAGYNTMDQEKKRRYDEKALCCFVGRLLIAISFCLVLLPVGVHFNLEWLIYGSSILTLVVTIGAVIYANTRNRFRRNDSSVERVVHIAPKPSTAKTAVTAMIAVVLIASIIVPVGVLLIYGAQEPVVNVLGDGVQIKGLYGTSVDFTDIAGISLIEKSMSDIGTGRRVSGYGGGDTLKGNFKSDYLGEILLFVSAKSAPTIYIERNSQKDIYLSFRDGEKTEELYREIAAAFSSVH